MIAAFDLGVKNFAFAVKSNGEYTLLKNLSLSSKVTKTDLNQLKKDDLIEMMNNLNLNAPKKETKKDIIDLIISYNKKQKKNDEEDLGLTMFKIMDEYKPIWNKCEIFLIERQMVTNLQALKLSHYLEAYLKLNYSEKKILNYNASLKTKKLGATNLKTKKDRKKWTIEYASTILKDENLRYYQSLNKKDDVADVVCMIQSYEL